MNDYDLALAIIGDYELTRRKQLIEIELLKRELAEATATEAEADTNE